MYGALGAVYLIVLLSVMLVIVLENRQPVRTVAWILVLMCFPVLGLVIYAFFGRNLKRGALISKVCAVQLARRSAHRFYRSCFPVVPEEHARLIYLFRRQSVSFLYPDNDVNVFTEGPAMLEQMLCDMAAARDHIHVEFYIFEDDETGRRVRDCLMKKAAEGVQVRVIYDDVGCWNVSSAFFAEMKKAGIEVCAFLPVRFPLFTSKVNYRNHRKIVVVDGKVGYVGGMNLADRYFNGAADRKGWRDTHMRLAGNAVLGLQRAFLADWYVAGDELIASSRYFPEHVAEEDKVPAGGISARKVQMQVVTSIPTDVWPDIMQGLVLILLRAKRYCYIQSPYFIPTDRVLFAMQTAAMSGVDVRLMLPEHADKKILTWASRSYLTDVMRAGVRVYLYRKTFLHAKAWVSDDSLFSCGSTNMDFRSFEHNFEINAFVYDKKIAQTMKRVFVNDQQHCRLLNLERWMERSTWRRVSESLIRVLTPLL
mgnify:FL=1